jgi:hypothetical protein
VLGSNKYRRMGSVYEKANRTSIKNVSSIYGDVWTKTSIYGDVWTKTNSKN